MLSLLVFLYYPDVGKISKLEVGISGEKSGVKDVEHMEHQSNETKNHDKFSEIFRTTPKEINQRNNVDPMSISKDRLFFITCCPIFLEVWMVFITLLYLWNSLDLSCFSRLDRVSKAFFWRGSFLLLGLGCSKTSIQRKHWNLQTPPKNIKPQHKALSSRHFLLFVSLSKAGNPPLDSRDAYDGKKMEGDIIARKETQFSFGCRKKVETKQHLNTHARMKTHRKHME